MTVPKGYYRDAEGNLKPDRRKSDERRANPWDLRQHEQRKFFRRKADLDLYEKHKAMINEALEDFAEEHGGQV